MSEIIGRFHPLIVHFPIAVLLIACLLLWLSKKEKYQSLGLAVNITMLIGMLSAVISCISGYLLSGSGEYDAELVNNHQWLGISVAVVAVIIYFINKNKHLAKIQLWLSFILCFLIIITGHLGGTLTHGEGYLSLALDTTATKFSKKIIPDIQEAKAYADVIEPILHEKCYTCHSSAKQKGQLRLDAAKWIIVGGKNGEVIIPGKPAESELYKRLLLDPLEKKHMPPKGKPQLSEQEVNLVHWWIVNNTSFDKKVKELEQPGKIKTSLLSLQSSQLATPAEPAVPINEIEKALVNDVEALQQAGVIVFPVAAKSNYLQANFVSIKRVDDKTIALLAPIKKQLVWLKLSAADLSMASLKVISNCTNLTRLNITNSNINDTGLAILTTLQELQYLNLAGTQVTAKGISTLTSLPHLINMYLAQTRIDKNDWELLQKKFPKATLDSGGYQVASLAIDTVLLKAPPR